jgi:hypothetical protein
MIRISGAALLIGSLYLIKIAPTIWRENHKNINRGYDVGDVVNRAIFRSLIPAIMCGISLGLYVVLIDVVSDLITFVIGLVFLISLGLGACIALFSEPKGLIPPSFRTNDKL